MNYETDNKYFIDNCFLRACKTIQEPVIFNMQENFRTCVGLRKRIDQDKWFAFDLLKQKPRLQEKAMYLYLLLV